MYKQKRKEDNTLVVAKNLLQSLEIPFSHTHLEAAFNPQMQLFR